MFVVIGVSFLFWPDDLWSSFPSEPSAALDDPGLAVVDVELTIEVGQSLVDMALDGSWREYDDLQAFNTRNVRLLEDCRSGGGECRRNQDKLVRCLPC